MVNLLNNITEEQMYKLFRAWAYCDYVDKSTEFMLEYMQDTAEVDLDTVLQFLEEQSPNRKQWYDENPNWLEEFNLKT